MPSPKRWLQPASDGGQNGGAGNGAAESLGERSVLEEVIPGAEEHLEEALVAESPNVGMNPNVDMVSNTEAEGRAVSVSPKPGEKRNWDATGGIDREMEVTVLRVLHKHGYQPSSSTSGRMVDQESQTDLIGEVLQAARRPLNKIKRDPSSSSQGGGSGHEQKGADSFEAAPAAEYAMGEEEILQMEAERLRQLSEEEDEMRQVSERDGFRKDEHLIKACDGTTWEWHLHEDGRQYYYCLDTQESKWTLPVVGEKMKSDEVVGSPSGNELEMEAALDSSSSTPKTESTRAFQGSVNSLGEKDFPLLSGIAVLGLVVTPRPRVLLMRRRFLETEQTSLELNIWFGKEWEHFLRVWQRWNRWVQKKRFPMWRSELCRLQKSEWWMWYLSFRNVVLEIWKTEGKGRVLRLRRSLRLVPRFLPFKGKKKLLE